MLIMPTFLIQFRFDILKENISMKLNLFFCLLVQTNAFRVPLPYGTGIVSSGPNIGSQGIFGLIWTWFAEEPDDNSVQLQGN